MEIIRPMSQYMVAPDESRCVKPLWRKLILPTMIARDESHNSPYPATIKVEGEPVTFFSKGHQDRWMDEHGYVRTADVCDDATFQDSQHSLFDRHDPPPNAEAEDCLKLMDWVDPSQVQDTSPTIEVLP